MRSQAVESCVFGRCAARKGDIRTAQQWSVGSFGVLSQTSHQRTQNRPGTFTQSLPHGRRNQDTSKTHVHYKIHRTPSAPSRAPGGDTTGCGFCRVFACSDRPCVEHGILCETSASVASRATEVTQSSQADRPLCSGQHAERKHGDWRDAFKEPTFSTS